MTGAVGVMLAVSRSGATLSIVLDRPAVLNALHPDMLLALSHALDEASRDEGISVITIEGAGEKAFSAGFDVKALAALPNRSGAASVQSAIDAVTSCPKPTIAVVRGHCLGAGLDLAMACDFRIADTTARFGMPVLRIGNVYPPRSIDRFVRLLGATVTMQLLVVGREFDAGAALVAGIVQEVSPPEDLCASVARWTAIPDMGRAASASHKRIVRELSTDGPRDDAFWARLEKLRDRALADPARAAALQRTVGRREPTA